MDDHTMMIEKPLFTIGDAERYYDALKRIAALDTTCQISEFSYNHQKERLPELSAFRNGILFVAGMAKQALLTIILLANFIV